MSSLNAQPPPSGDPFQRFNDRIVNLERQVASLTQLRAVTTTWYGPRSDLSGQGPRVAAGLLSDGTYGVEVWSASGVRTVLT
jgi:hypothetical protein